MADPRPATAIIGLPKSGTSLLYDVLAHDPAWRAAVYEPLHEAVLDVKQGHTALWFGTEAMNETLIEHTRAQFMSNLAWWPGVLSPVDVCAPLDDYVRPFREPGILSKWVHIAGRVQWFSTTAAPAQVIATLRHPVRWASTMIPNARQWDATHDYLGMWLARVWGGLQADPRTAAAAYRLDAEHHYVRLLHVWGIYARDVLDEALDRFPSTGFDSLHIEKLSADPDAVLAGIYPDGVPPEVAARIHNPSSRFANITYPHKWLKPITTEADVHRALTIDDTWRRWIAAAGIEPIMREAGYDAD